MGYIGYYLLGDGVYPCVYVIIIAMSHICIVIVQQHKLLTHAAELSLNDDSVPE